MIKTWPLPTVVFTLWASAIPAYAVDANDVTFWQQLQWIRSTADLTIAEQQRRLPQLIALLDSDNLDLRLTAAEVIARYGPRAKTAIGPLINQFDEPNGEAGSTYSDSVAAIGKAALPELYRTASGGDWLPRARACDALHRLQPDRFGAECRPLRNDQFDDPAFRRLHRALLTQAGAMLERYGDSFYALAYYLNPQRQLRQLLPAENDDSTAAIADALRARYRAKRPDATHALLAQDLPSQQLLGARFEEKTGRCLQLLQRYHFSTDGRVAFDTPVVSDCRPGLLRPPPGND